MDQADPRVTGGPGTLDDPGPTGQLRECGGIGLHQAVVQDLAARASVLA